MRGIVQRLGLPPAGLWLLAGTFVTTVGNGMHTLTVGKLLYDRTGSAAAFGEVIIFEQVVAFLMQLVAGPWVDRGDPKRTCVQVEVIRGVFVCLASAMLGSRHLVIWIMLMTLVIRVAQPFYRAAMFALVPEAVTGEALSRYNGYSNICLQGGQLLGVVLAGLVIAQWGAPAAFLLNGLTFLFSAAAVAVITLARREPDHEHAAGLGNPWTQVIAGWRELILLVRQEAGLAWHLLLNTIDSLAVILFNLLLVPVVADRFGGSTYWLSMVDGAFAVGAMATAAVVTPITTRWGSRITAVIGIFGQAVCFLLLTLARPAWVTLVMAFGVGAFNTISWTVLMTTLQLRVRGPFKGRIGTARNLLTAAISAVLVPLVSRTAGLSLAAAMVVSGGVCLVFAGIAWFYLRPEAEMERGRATCS